MLAQANRNAADFMHATRKAVVAGSDSHTLAGLARTYTEVPRRAYGLGIPGRLAPRTRKRRGRIGQLIRNSPKAVWSIGLDHAWRKGRGR